jgi:hypothetical protein
MNATELVPSEGRFPDGASFRIEIPSTEGPACLDAVLEEADRLDVPVTRVSQGSGVSMLTDAELDRMATTAADAGIEVSLFVRPGAGWGPSATARALGGGVAAAVAWGKSQFDACVADIARAADHGFRSVLIADIGVLATFGRMRANGELPGDMSAKVSVMLPVANAAAARVIEDLGGGTLNVAGDLSVHDLAAIRDAVSMPIDLYVESPDDLGGLVRLHEAPELIRVLAPVHLKLGLRNAPPLYPSGGHLEAPAIATSRERVRRARLLMELLDRSGGDLSTSKPHADGLGIPVP